MSGDLNLGGNDITGVGSNITGNGPVSVSATGGSSDLALNSDRDVNLNALNGDINLNSSDSTINANANTTVSGTLGVTEEDSMSGDNTDVVTVTHTIAGGNGEDQIGTGILFQVEDSNGVIEDIGRISSVATISGPRS